MRIGAAQREFSRANVERNLAPGYGCVWRADWLRLQHYSTTARPTGPILGTKAMTACGGSGRSALAQPPKGNIWHAV